MQLNKIGIIFICGATLFAQDIIEDEIHHQHILKSKVKLDYTYLDFKNSKQKDNGNNFSIKGDFEDKKNHLELFYSYAKTNTKQPPLSDDLKVDKISARYRYTLNKKNKFNFSYLYVKDNLAPTDGGNIYGVGYSYKFTNITQFVSDYKDFNVYQTNLKVGFKKENLFGAVVGMYQNISNHTNSFTKNAKDDYYSALVNLHYHYDNFHTNIGGIFGKRVFSVLDRGLFVQHHSMEFKYSFMIGLGYKYKNINTHLKYSYHKAKELPINNDNVKISAYSVSIDYIF